MHLQDIIQDYDDKGVGVRHVRSGRRQRVAPRLAHSNGVLPINRSSDSLDGVHGADVRHLQSNYDGADQVCSWYWCTLSKVIVLMNQGRKQEAEGAACLISVDKGREQQKNSPQPLCSGRHSSGASACHSVLVTGRALSCLSSVLAGRY